MKGQLSPVFLIVEFSVSLLLLLLAATLLSQNPIQNEIIVETTSTAEDYRTYTLGLSAFKNPDMRDALTGDGTTSTSDGIQAVVEMMKTHEEVSYVGYGQKGSLNTLTGERGSTTFSSFHVASPSDRNRELELGVEGRKK